MGNFASSALDFCGSWSKSSTSSGISHPTCVTLNGADYRIEKLLGEGGYAYVYLANLPSANGKKIALKRFVIHEPELQERFIEETRIHRNICPHDNIVTFLDSEVKQRKNVPLPEVWVAMELCNDSLQNIVNKRKLSGRSVTVAEIKEIAKSVLAALVHMHSQSPPVAHFDIKLDNILSSSQGTSTTYKLCDFGSACKGVFYQCRNAQDVTIAEAELGQRMTLLYRSPESLDLWKKHRIDTKCDVWSLGVLFYVLVFLDMPFDENAMSIMKCEPKALAEAASIGKIQRASPGKDASGGATPTHVSQVDPLLKPFTDVIFNEMLVADPAQRGDIFYNLRAPGSVSHLEPASETPAWDD